MFEYIDDNGNLLQMDMLGGTMVITPKEDLKNMLAPVRCCHCGKAYDLSDVHVNHRFGDCDEFTTPCCGYEHADTRTYKSFPDIKYINL